MTAVAYVPEPATPPGKQAPGALPAPVRGAYVRGAVDRPQPGPTRWMTVIHIISANPMRGGAVLRADA